MTGHSVAENLVNSLGEKNELSSARGRVFNERNHTHTKLSSGNQNHHKKPNKQKKKKKKPGANYLQ